MTDYDTYWSAGILGLMLGGSVVVLQTPMAVTWVFMTLLTWYLLIVVMRSADSISYLKSKEGGR